MRVNPTVRVFRPEATGGDPGDSPFEFRPISTATTSKRYCNAELALSQILSLPLPADYGGPNRIDGCFSANAEFQVDDAEASATFVSSECPQLAYDSQRKVSGMVLSIRVGGLSSVACRIGGADGSIQEIVFAQRKETKGIRPIDYRFALKTTRPNYAADHVAFLRWLAIDPPDEALMIRRMAILIMGVAALIAA